MGLEFKPYWEEEEEEEAQARSSSNNNNVPKAQSQQQQQQQQVLLEKEKADESDELMMVPGCLAAVNEQHREYAVLVAEEEEDVNEYKSWFSIVLDYPQFLGQGETRESALRHASRLLHYAFGSMLLKNEAVPPPSDPAQVETKKAAMERDWQLVKLENFSMELVPLRFQPGIDYTARPPESDGEYESDHEDEELFELESRMSTP